MGVRTAISSMTAAGAAYSQPAQTAWGQPQPTPARTAIVIDMTSGAVLLEKNADMSIPPASMSKLMTLEVVFNALETGRLSLDDSFRTSDRAAAMGG